MEKEIKIIEIISCNKSAYISPKRVFYMQEGVEKYWDFIKSHDSVSVILYHKERDSFVLVKQFRPALFINHEGNDGVTYELCAGIMDKNTTEIKTIKEEILEECGYEVDEKNIKKVVSCFSSVGIAASKQTIFFSFIEESMRVSKGGGVKNEFIELYFLRREDAKKFLFDESKPKGAGLLFAISWFFENENKLH